MSNRIRLFGLEKGSFTTQSAEKAQELTINLAVSKRSVTINNLVKIHLVEFTCYLLLFGLLIKCTSLFALLTNNRRPILSLIICASLTFLSDECSQNVTEFTVPRFSYKIVKFSFVLKEGFVNANCQLPNCFTFCSHFLQIGEVEPLLKRELGAAC